MFAGRVGRKRRGGSSTLAIIGLTTTIMTLGLEMDTGRLYVARHKDQVISDAITMAAGLELPYRDQCEAAAGTVANLYKSSYNSEITYSLEFYPDTDVPTSLSVSVVEEVPTLLSGMTGIQTLETSAPAAAARVIPTAVLQGLAPIGVEYTQFAIPANGYASESVTDLKLGKGDKKAASNGCYALDLPGGSGASDWREWLKYGYTSQVAVGDVIRAKPGTMSGPTDIALVTDLDSRMNRSLTATYARDSYSSFTTGNPRIIVVPLVKWVSNSGGAANLEIKGFAAFWLDTYIAGSGTIRGRFIRLCASRSGSWSGLSLDADGISEATDGGFWFLSMTN